MLLNIERASISIDIDDDKYLSLDLILWLFLQVIKNPLIGLMNVSEKWLNPNEVGLLDVICGRGQADSACTL